MSNIEEKVETTATTTEQQQTQEAATTTTANTTATDATTVQESAAGQQENGDAQKQHQPKKNKYLKCNYKYCKHYEDINQIVKSFKDLASLQAPLDVQAIPNALSYVIRSNNDDDVHKAIKYGIWTSVPGNNVKLNNAYEKAKQQGVDVYLFFSVVKSGQFIGVAKLISSYQEETFSYWWQPHKFKGHFKIQWIFVKDVKQKAFEGLKNCQNDDISRSKDCTELDFDTTGRKMLQIYKDSNSSTSIFQDFVYLDQKEQMIRSTYSYFGRQSNKNFQNQRNNNNNGNNVNNNNNNLNNNLYTSMFMNPQMMGSYPQYTPEQLTQLSQMCFTNIYPPNSYPQYSSPFIMPSNGQNHQGGKNYHAKRNNNNNKKNNHSYKEKNHHSQQQQTNNNTATTESSQQQQKVEEQKI